MKKVFCLFPIIPYFLYIFLILSAFPPIEQSLENPILSFDHPFHITNAQSAVDFFIKDRANCGYTPFSASGTTICQSVSNRIVTPFFLLLPFANKDLLYSLIVFIALLLSPLLIGAAASLFFGKQYFLKGIGLASLLFVSSPLIHQFIFVGHWGFLLSLCVSLFASAALYKYSATGKKSLLILQAVLYALALWIHLLSFFTSVPYILTTLLLLWRRKESKKALAITLATGSIVLAINIFWLHLMFGYVFMENSTGEMAQYLQSKQLWHGRIFQEIFIVVTFIFAIYVLCRKKISKTVLYPLTICIVTLLVISFFGSDIKLQDAQPVRYVIGIGMLAILTITKHRYSFLLSLALSLIFISVPGNRITISRWQKASQRPFSQSSKDLLNFLDNKANRSSRVLIQMSHYPQYNKTRIASIVAHRLKIPIVNNELPYPLIFASFVDDIFMNKNIANISDTELETFMSSYNVRYVLVFSENAVSRFCKLSMFTQVYKDNTITIFDYLHHKDSYCYECNAELSISKDQIVVNNAHNENELIIKFHNHGHFRVEPPNVEISSTYLMKDPLPFIKLKGTKGIQSIKINF